MKRQVSCGQFSCCLLTDCGKCINCLDKGKFDGPNNRKQHCVEYLCHCRYLRNCQLSTILLFNMQSYLNATMESYADTCTN